jgi:dCMP deaminase
VSVSDAVVAYIPVLHEGFVRFLDAHGRGRPLYLIGPEVYADYRPLAKDIRAFDAHLMARAIGALGICSGVSVLTAATAAEVAASGASLTLPAEDVSYQVVERFFPRAEVRYDTVFLRWDKTKTVQLLRPRPDRRVDSSDALAELQLEADAAAANSIDWWRQVGAAIRLPTGEVRSASNQHAPREIAPYVVGDPRSNFFKGVHLDLSTAMHAEAQLIADAARTGTPTDGAVMFVTDFPCPPCAKLIAAAGITRLFFCDGYAVLDGADILAAAGVEVVEIATVP